jgi:uncharacterized membrane protein YfcA
MTTTWEQTATLVFSAAVGGAVNAVAGGGTLLTFPALIWAGQTSLAANATSTVALLPGAFSSFWGYRSEIGNLRQQFFLLIIPSLIGGIAGAVLLTKTDASTFDLIVPYLILLATTIFIVQEPLARLQRRIMGHDLKDPGDKKSDLPESQRHHRSTSVRFALVFLAQLAIGVYGGYFGAGIGILMLAAYTMLGITNIHQANVVKVINGGSINCVASILFIWHGLVDWRLAGVMAGGALLGGYSGAGIARRIGQRNVRRLVVCIGIALAVSLLAKQYKLWNVSGALRVP